MSGAHNKTIINKKQIQRIIHQYTKLGKSAYKIAKQCNFTYTIIYRILHENNIKIRNPHDCHRKYKINESYFNKINTPNKAYFLGLLYADGAVCINGNRCYTISINLQARDKHILTLLNKELKYNKPLDFIDRTKENNKQNQYKVIIYSEKIAKDLNKLGCIVNKSLTVKWPSNEQVPTKLIRHFIRGYFDGDGTVCLSSVSKTPKKRKYIRQIRFGIIGTFNTCYYFRKYMVDTLNFNKIKILKHHSTRDLFYIVYTGNKLAKKFSNLLYNKVNKATYLKRKYKRFKVNNDKLPKTH